MILESITRDGYARELGLVSDGCEISERGLADLLRAPLARWGLSSKTKLLSYARTQLEAAGLRDRASGLVAKVLGRLVQLKECVEIYIDGETYIGPAQPQWIRTGYETGTLLGVAPVPNGIVELAPNGSGRDIVRRIVVRNDKDLAALLMAGFREILLEEWLRPYKYQLHAMRRKDRLIRSDEMNLAQFWELLMSAIQEESLPLGDDAEIRIVGGEPGEYFGKYNSEKCEGRWTETAPDGIWCAYRRGYSQAHWNPTIVAIDGGHRRALDLYDKDEWCWALLARGKSTGTEERFDRQDRMVRLSVPAPDQLMAAMDLLGPRRSGWSWRVNDGAVDPWTLLG